MFGFLSQFGFDVDDAIRKHVQDRNPEQEQLDARLQQMLDAKLKPLSDRFEQEREERQRQQQEAARAQQQEALRREAMHLHELLGAHKDEFPYMTAYYDDNRAIDEVWAKSVAQYQEAKKKTGRGAPVDYLEIMRSIDADLRVRHEDAARRAKGLPAATQQSETAVQASEQSEPSPSLTNSASKDPGNGETFYTDPFKERARIQRVLNSRR